ncbi:hypothetical protein H5410_032254 [Solanum commersonii]|uniref:Uncharacterized protein n=1 Tax=Solanum commersonii TaxID=4109 RepID=A0A9J5YP50_SOLCO|nr:hypothetical protein H5410_032254 [Solanum commersonii]
MNIFNKRGSTFNSPTVAAAVATRPSVAAAVATRPSIAAAAARLSLFSHIIEITGTKFPSSLFSTMLIWSL